MYFNYPIRVPESLLKNIILWKFLNVMWPASLLLVPLNGPCFTNYVWYPWSNTSWTAYRRLSEAVVAVFLEYWGEK